MDIVRNEEYLRIFASIPSFSFSGILEQSSVTLKGVTDSTLVLEKGIELREGKYFSGYRYKYTKRRLDQLSFFLLGYVSSRIKR